MNVFLTFYLWNDLTILWNDLTFLWNDLTLLWNEMTWNDLTMERFDRKPPLDHTRERLTQYTRWIGSILICDHEHDPHNETTSICPKTLASTL